MDEVIQYDKTLQQRMNEYMEIFCDDKQSTAESIHKVWTFYLDMNVDPSGWQAIWKVPRMTCEELKIPFPSVMLVYVEIVDFLELDAMVRVLAVQDDFEIAETHHVQLMNLWPTKSQDPTIVLYMHTTANVLDMYRFFYTNIFLPWDHDDVDGDWLNTHLMNRLRLYYELKNGAIPRPTAEHIKALLTEARRIQNNRHNLHLDLIDEHIELDDVSNEKVLKYVSMHMDMRNIKHEMEHLENPLTRRIIIERLQDENQVEQRNPQNWVILEEGKIGEYLELLQQIQGSDPGFDSPIKMSSCLQTVLEGVRPEDTIILGKNSHVIKCCSGLETGGIVKGVFEKEATILKTTNENVMLDFRGEALIENITIDASFSQCGILIRAGKTTLRNCKIHGDNKSSTHQGIIVLQGGCLEMIDCEIAGFYTAIVANTGSQVQLNQCDIYEANVGIKMYDSCTLKAENCKFHDCINYGLCLETSSEINHTRCSGDFKLLEVVPGVEIKDLTGSNNSKGNVLINPVVKLTPKEDVFSVTMPTVPSKKSGSLSDAPSDEDMECDANVTVIEKPTPEAGDVQ